MPNDEAIHDGRIDLATEVDVTSNAARFYSALHRFAVSLTRNDLTRRIWRNKRFSFWLSDYIKSETSLRSSAGCLRRFIGSSYIKSAAEESISKWSSYLIFTIWRQGNRSLGDPWMGESSWMPFCAWMNCVKLSKAAAEVRSLNSLNNYEPNT